jgi:hypothetical protein
MKMHAKFSSGNLIGKRRLGRPKSKWEDIVSMGI